MENGPGTSKGANSQPEECEMKQWTKELKDIPPFSYELLQKHLCTDPNMAKA